MRPTLLVLDHDTESLTRVANAARADGFTVAVGRAHELAIDSLTRVHADVALVHIAHEGADSIAFSGLAAYRGTRVFLFACANGNAEDRARITLVSSRSPFPVLQYSGDAAELVAAVASAAAGGTPGG